MPGVKSQNGNPQLTPECLTRSCFPALTDPCLPCLDTYSSSSFVSFSYSALLSHTGNNTEGKERPPLSSGGGTCSPTPRPVSHVSSAGAKLGNLPALPKPLLLLLFFLIFTLALTYTAT